MQEGWEGFKVPTEAALKEINSLQHKKSREILKNLRKGKSLPLMDNEPRVFSSNKDDYEGFSEVVGL